MSIRTSLNLMLHDDAEGPEPLAGSGINPESSQLIEWPQQNKQWQMWVIRLYSSFQPAFIWGKHHLMERDKANLLLILTPFFVPKLDNGISFDHKSKEIIFKLQSTTKENYSRLQMIFLMRITWGGVLLYWISSHTKALHPLFCSCKHK